MKLTIAKRQKQWIFYVFILLLGMVLGLTLDNIFLINVKNEYSLTEILNLIVTILIALLIPLILAPSLDAQRHIKNIIIGDIERFTDQLNDMQGMIYSWASNDGQFDMYERIKFNMEIRKLDSIINTIGECINEQFATDLEDELKHLKQGATEYWRNLTGGDFMESSFSVNSRYLRLHDITKMKLERRAKIMIFAINNI